MTRRKDPGDPFMSWLSAWLEQRREPEWHYCPSCGSLMDRPHSRCYSVACDQPKRIRLPDQKAARAAYQLGGLPAVYVLAEQEVEKRRWETLRRERKQRAMTLAGTRTGRFSVIRSNVIDHRRRR